jgi:uncharacterized protein (UPF0333 family)
MKGQISIEVISGVVILLLVFVVILFYSHEKNLDADALQNSIESKAYCRQIADTISSVYVSGEKTTIEFYFEKDFNVGSSFVDVNGFSCSYNAVVEPKYLNKGNIRIKDLNGVVVIENF